MTSGLFRDLIPIHKNTYMNLERQGIDLEKLYKVFNNDKLRNKQKKKYLNNLDILFKTKETIWERFIGE